MIKPLSASTLSRAKCKGVYQPNTALGESRTHWGLLSSSTRMYMIFNNSGKQFTAHSTEHLEILERIMKQSLKQSWKSPSSVLRALGDLGYLFSGSAQHCSSIRGTNQAGLRYRLLNRELGNTPLRRPGGRSVRMRQITSDSPPAVSAWLPVARLDHGVS